MTDDLTRPAPVRPTAGAPRDEKPAGYPVDGSRLEAGEAPPHHSGSYARPDRATTSNGSTPERSNSGPSKTRFHSEDGRDPGPSLLRRLMRRALGLVGGTRTDRPHACPYCGSTVIPPRK